MACYIKQSNNKWSVKFYYKNWQGCLVNTTKRGFNTKKEAKLWYENFILNKAKDLNMSFELLVESYIEDMRVRIKLSTFTTKLMIINKWILPYLGKKSCSDISASDIRKWQSMLLSQNFKPTYLKTVHCQLSAIFNYAVKFYDLRSNPCVKAGSIGSKYSELNNFWTVDDFSKFIDQLIDNIDAYIGFKLLFWTGIRIGELLALNYYDFDLEEKTLSISKSYQRIEGKDMITSPKTNKSKRVIGLPTFLVEELKDFFARTYEVELRERIFPYTKYFFERAMKSACKRSGVKKIRLHDLRHSHASLLVNKGLDAMVIANRLGHERIETTLNIYSHLYKESIDKAVNILEELENDQDKAKKV